MVSAVAVTAVFVAESIRRKMGENEVHIVEKLFAPSRKSKSLVGCGNFQKISAEVMKPGLPVVHIGRLHVCKSNLQERPARKIALETLT